MNDRPGITADSYDNPFLRLQNQRLRDGARRSGFRAALRDQFGGRRAYAKHWMTAWREAFDLDFTGYGVGLDAWYPMRDQITAQEFIERYMPRASDSGARATKPPQSGRASNKGQQSRGPRHIDRRSVLLR